MLNSPLLLAVEDEESDALLLKLAVETAAIASRLLVLRDGQEFIDYMSRRAPFENASEFPIPNLVLLDLKMPRVNGFEVLTWLGTQSELHQVPVVVFSASTCEADMQKAFELGARDYLPKPSRFKTLVEIVRSVHNCWLVTDGRGTFPKKRGVPSGPAA